MALHPSHPLVEEALALVPGQVRPSLSPHLEGPVELPRRDIAALAMLCARHVEPLLRKQDNWPTTQSLLEVCERCVAGGGTPEDFEKVEKVRWPERPPSQSPADDVVTLAAIATRHSRHQAGRHSIRLARGAVTRTMNLLAPRSSSAPSEPGTRFLSELQEWLVTREILAKVRRDISAEWRLLKPLFRAVDEQGRGIVWIARVNHRYWALVRQGAPVRAEGDANDVLAIVPDPLLARAADAVLGAKSG